MQIIDNFFPEEHFKRLQESILGSELPWYYTDNISVPKGVVINEPLAIETSALQTILFDRINNYMSDECHKLTEVFNYMITQLGFEPVDLLKIRASMKWPQQHISESNYNIPHIDLPFPHTVGLFYVNDSDGPTRIFDQYQPSKVFPKIKRDEAETPESLKQINDFYIREGFTVKELIEPKANRMVLFDGYQYHTSGLPVTSNRRVVLNINFNGVK